ncbi:ATP synthase F1 subunit epsilon [Allofournierella sp.]|uniref:ATP synthase F1 subunit epsilon n=1 Tax=Allofournierella sp. TaxID=1940256 RepID=UPI003AB3420C
MSTFQLQIVTPDGSAFDGQAQKLFCRTIAGDVCILPRHCDYLTALGMGEARVTLEDGTVRRAACIGGMLAVAKGRARLVATTFEWAENIDAQRARAAQEKAKARLAEKDLDAREMELAQAKLKRALVRTHVAEGG